LPHESNRNRKLLFKTGKIGLSDFRNRTLRFCRDRQQSGTPPDFDEVLLLRLSDVWTVEGQEPRQPRRLKWWLIHLIDENKKKKTRVN
jgi:hypothetical protein